MKNKKNLLIIILIVVFIINTTYISGENINYKNEISDSIDYGTQTPIVNAGGSGNSQVAKGPLEEVTSKIQEKQSTKFELSQKVDSI